MSMTILRSFLAASRPQGIAVDLVGAGTAWTAGTTFTLSGVTPLPTILTTIVSSATTARLVIATGAVTTAQTLTISDGTNTGTVVVQPVAAARGKWFPGLARR